MFFCFYGVLPCSENGEKNPKKIFLSSYRMVFMFDVDSVCWESLTLSGLLPNPIPIGLLAYRHSLTCPLSSLTLNK